MYLFLPHQSSSRYEGCAPRSTHDPVGYGDPHGDSPGITWKSAPLVPTAHEIFNGVSYSTKDEGVMSRAGASWPAF